MFKLDKGLSQKYLLRFTNKELMDNYFYSLASSDGITYNDVPYIHVEKPILVLSEYEQLLTYTCGRFKINSNSRWIYFNIVDFESIALNKTNIIYEIDPYLTFLFDENGDKFRFGYTQCLRRSQIYKFKLTNPESIPLLDKPFYDEEFSRNFYYQYKDAPLFPNQQVVLFLSLTQMKIGSSPDIPGNSYVNGPFYCCIYDSSIFDSSDYFRVFKNWFIASDVSGAWFVPVNSLGGSISFGDKYIKSTFDGHDYFMGYYTKLNNPDGVRTENLTLTNESVLDYTDSIQKRVITDEYGNVLFTAPFGVLLTTVKIVYRMSVSNCQIDFIFNNTDYDKANLESLAFTYMCKSADIVIDSEIEYNARNKQYEKEIRQLQNNQSLVDSLSNVGMGAIGGGLVGGGVGVLVGGGLGVATAGIQYGSNQYFNSQYINLEEKKYNQQQDIVNTAMTGTGAILVKSALRMKILRIDEPSQLRARDILNTVGHKVNEIWEYGEPLFLATTTLTCIPTILGNIPLRWKQEIVNKFANGVILTDVV